MKRNMLLNAMATTLFVVLVSVVQVFGDESIDRLNMVWISPGTFVMGSPTNEANRGAKETQHTVTLTSGFYMGKYEVTQGEYLAVIGNNPSFFNTNHYYKLDLNRPVEQVNWIDATNYCYILTKQERIAGRIKTNWVFRLPTEAEWEYACRAGTTTAFSFGNIVRVTDATFWHSYIYDTTNGNVYVQSPMSLPYQSRTTTVGSYKANPWGLYDMHGNLWEWCQDYWSNYTIGLVIDPSGASSGTHRILRGGHWSDKGGAIGSARRGAYRPEGTMYGFGFRIVLSPVIREWNKAITIVPSQPTYGNYPIKGVGKNSLVIMTHGWINRFASPLGLNHLDQTWVNSMSNVVAIYLASHSLSSWQVHGYNWKNNAWKFTAPDALVNAEAEGIKLGNALAMQGWDHIHLIGHSAGAQLIDTASRWIKVISPNTSIHCTFLDAYVGNDNAGVDNYGDKADWADSYFSYDVTGDVTEQSLDNVYNINVTQLGPKKVIRKFQSQTTGQIESCTKTIHYHGWSVDFYINTIAGSGITSGYSWFGFPLSKEGGNWNYALANYTRGGLTNLGNPDPICGSDIQLIPISYPNTLPNFTQLPTIESTTGSIQKWFGSLKLLSGSPAWFVSVISSTNPVNTVSFSVRFTSTNGSQGLLSVYWDDQVIGSIDERVITTNSYSLRFPNATPNSSHVLGFRLDPFTNIQSVVTITNITLNQVGVSQPFSLVSTIRKTNGVPIWELTGQAGFAYGIQASTNISGTNWIDIAELVNTNGTVLFYDQSATNHQRLFYRVYIPESK